MELMKEVVYLWHHMWILPAMFINISKVVFWFTKILAMWLKFAQIIWKNQSIKGEKKLFVCVVWWKIYSVPETEIIFLYPFSMLSQMGQSMCSILEYQTLIDINVVTDDIDLPKRYIQLYFFREIEVFFLINCICF